jgi:hypothetical protein
MAEIDQRRIAAKDSELDNMLAKALGKMPIPAQSIAAAIKDPAMMRKLVDQAGKDPRNACCSCAVRSLRRLQRVRSRADCCLHLFKQTKRA